MTPSFFSAVTRSITLAVTTLGLVAATVYQFVHDGHADEALLGVTTGFVGAFTGAHIGNTAGSVSASSTAPADTTSPTEGAPS